MEDNRAHNKKIIVKNTLALYMRTAITMVVSLIITRVLLEQLGEDNYGIYNVVASVVILFSFLNASLSQTIQRFITFNLGTGDLRKTSEVFSISLISQFIICFILIILCETLGVWFINYKMVISSDQIYAANIAFQFSLLTFSINFFKVPYESSIIAYEKMNIFAYMSIIDVLLKLATVYCIEILPGDKLISYTFLLTVESLIMLLVYRFYCIHKFDICNFRLIWNTSIFKKIITFSGWNVFGAMANIFGQKGVVILLNMFVGLIANAAMGITNQIYSALTAFISSFQTSFRPQIVKSYATNDIEYTKFLISTTSKFSFILMYIPSTILIINMPLILNIWLNDVPQYTTIFCQLITICCVIDAISGPYNCAIMATGNIRNYQLLLSISCIIDVVFCYIILRFGWSIYLILVSRILTRGVINMGVGLYYLKKLICFDLIRYNIQVIRPIILFTILQFPFLYLFNMLASGWYLMIISTIFTVIIGIPCAYFIMLSQRERTYLKEIFSRLWK